MNACYGKHLPARPVTWELTVPVRVQVSVILFNLLSGPPLFRAAVISAGEARALLLDPSSSPPTTPRTEHKHT